MAWKWYEVKSYKASLGFGDYYYAGVQLFGDGFYAYLQFHKTGPLPDATAPVIAGAQRFYGFMDYQQMQLFVDLLRSEKPINFGWLEEKPNDFHLMTGLEPVGEADGLLASVTA